MLDRTKSCYEVNWIHPENTLQIDSSSLCAIWIERIRKVNPRDKLTRMSRGRCQHLSNRRSARRNSPNNLRNCSTRKSSTEEGVQRGNAQRKTATCILSWSIGSDPKRNGVQLSNEPRQPGGRCRHINRFALSSPNGQPPHQGSPPMPKDAALRSRSTLGRGELSKTPLCCSSLSVTSRGDCS